MTAHALGPVPALVVGRVTHARRVGVQNWFAHRSYQWLVDLDRLPRLPWWLRPVAGFDPRDHLGGGPTGTRAELAELLAGNGEFLHAGDRVLMLTNARVLGHVFNPLTVYWVRPDEPDPGPVVLEVHNTYGQRHCYVLRLDPEGRASTAKEFYVSPFNDVSGTYRVRIRRDPHRVHVRVTLVRDEQVVMTASSGGTVVAATPLRVLRVAGRHAFMTQRTTVLIRLHGIRLWLRRLPVQPRPRTAPPHRTSTPDRQEYLA